MNLNMKGKSEFSVTEAAQIEMLIEQKLRATSNEQKKIRNKIRALGFYATDWGIGSGYTVADFRRVVKVLGNDDKSFFQPPISKSIVSQTKSEDITNNIYDTINLNHNKPIIPQLNELGFKGFVTIEAIKNTNYQTLPKVRGVYIILYSTELPEFISIGSGGAFKGRNPNVPIDDLQSNWVNNSPILYIGKAGSETGTATIHSRLKQYFQFGEGKPVGHWGGRYIWQLANADNLIICWLELPNGIPAKIETALIKEFSHYYGQRPFANLKD